MALTPTEKLSIVRILGILPSLLDAQITVLGASLDSDREAAIREEITRWTTSGGKFVRIKAKESNKGVETDSSEAKADIIKNLMALFEFPVSACGGIGTIQIG